MGGSMVQRAVRVTHREEIATGVFVLRFESKEISDSAAPGQFVNIRCGESCVPLLRRPFSISRILDGEIELLFNVIGQGTRLLASKESGEDLDVIGPLGTPFRYRGEYDTAFLVAGGMGVAPFPFLTSALRAERKGVVTFVGAREASQLILAHLENVQLATDDGSRGYHGTVVELLREYLGSHRHMRTKIFGCGPLKMLKTLARVAREFGIDCEVSLEGDMACGIGLCQGCPVEQVDGKKKYALVCVDGPVFNSKEIILP